MSELTPGPALRILIVEDDAVAALGLKMFVLETGHEVVAVAASTPAAIHAASAVRPDLALVDVRLADGSDGVEAAVEIWRRLGIPSILITGDSDRAAMRRAEAAHPLDLLLKPILPHQLRWSLTGAAALLQAGWSPGPETAGRP